MNNDITKELLLKYFDGQVTAVEKQSIDAWAKNSENQELFFACLMQWENQNPQFKPDVKAAFANHKARVNAQKDIGQESKTEKRSFRRILAIAASIALFLTIGGGYLFKDILLFKTYTTGFGKIESFTLSDGTHIVLNSNSSLRVPRFGFSGETREVFLTGESNFDVTHTVDNQYFVVKTAKDFEVVVLGTMFSVFARPSGSKVILDRGKVQLNYAENKTPKQVTLSPGELVTIDSVGHVHVKKTKIPENLSAWKSNRFVFDETPLSDLVTLFADNYGLQLIITNKELSKWTISGSFTAYNAEELLDAMTESSELVYQKKDKQIFISNK